MPPFTRADLGTFDWQMFLTGPVARFDDPARLNETITRLRDKGYRVEEFDCAAWADERSMHEDLSATLNFPGLYGMNLDALNDRLWPLEFRNYLGLILVFRNFAALSSNSMFRPRTDWHLLDLLAIASRNHLLWGDRFLAIIELQADAGDIPEFGGHHVNYPVSGGGR